MNKIDRYLLAEFITLLTIIGLIIGPIVLGTLIPTLGDYIRHHIAFDTMVLIMCGAPALGMPLAFYFRCQRVALERQEMYQWIKPRQP